MQHYRCVNCGKQFQNKRRAQALEKSIWRKHVWERQTVNNLKNRYNKSEKTIRKILDKVNVSSSLNTEPQSVVCVFDATHIGKDTLLVARSHKLKTNLVWAWIENETKEAYSLLRANLAMRGFVLSGVVLDGRTGIPRVFGDIPVQICQFHQLQIVRRKLTLKPESLAGQDLLSFVFTIAHTTEKVFNEELQKWHTKYEEFINEKTYTLGTKKGRYTHRRIRSAYLSLKRNSSFLFTYQKYPHLNIPNTTNSLDGYWSRLKNLLSAHRGKSKERIRKIATEILRKQTA